MAITWNPDTSMFEWLFGSTTVIGTHWLLPLILSIIVMAIVTVELQKWKILLLPTLASLGAIGITTSPVIYVLASIIFANETFHVEIIGNVIRGINKSTNKAINQSALNKLATQRKNRSVSKKYADRLKAGTFIESLKPAKKQKGMTKIAQLIGDRRVKGQQIHLEIDNRTPYYELSNNFNNKELLRQKAHKRLGIKPSEKTMMSIIDAEHKKQQKHQEKNLNKLKNVFKNLETYGGEEPSLKGWNPSTNKKGNPLKDTISNWQPSTNKKREKQWTPKHNPLETIKKWSPKNTYSEPLKKGGGFLPKKRTTYKTNIKKGSKTGNRIINTTRKKYFTKEDIDLLKKLKRNKK